MAEEKFEMLSDREHILKRPGLYLGSIVPEIHKRFIAGNLVDTVYTPALKKALEEIIDNAVDEGIRSEQKITIKIKIDSKSMEVSDTGRGIPVEKIGNRWRPEIAWTELRSGTSFNDKERFTLGTNGVGSSCANVFSKEFIGETHDGKNCCKVHCTWNMSNISTSTRASKSHGTKVTVFPDLQKFGTDCIQEDCISIIKERILALAISYPFISFEFNNEKIKFKKPDEYLEIFGEIPLLEKFENGFVGVFGSLSGDFEYYSVVNGLCLSEGGSHISYISNELCNILKAKIKRKYKIELSNAEIKKGLRLVVIGTKFENMQFNSQTKESLRNTESDVKKWLHNLNIDKLAKKVFDAEEIIQPIIEVKLAKQAAIDKRTANALAKKQSKQYVKNHIRANSKNRQECILFLTEGLSATAMLAKVRDTKTEGGLPLRGLVLNTYELSEKKILENQELSNIMSVLGLSFGQTDFSTLQYGTIGLFQDQDVDGWSIRGLLLLFFSKWPGLFQENRIKLVTSPILIASKGKDIKYFYDKHEYEVEKDNLKGYSIKYCKGLGALNPKDYRYALDHKEKWENVEIDEEKYFKELYSEAEVGARKRMMSE